MRKTKQTQAERIATLERLTQQHHKIIASLAQSLATLTDLMFSKDEEE